MDKLEQQIWDAGNGARAGDSIARAGARAGEIAFRLTTWYRGLVHEIAFRLTTWYRGLVHEIALMRTVKWSALKNVNSLVREKSDLRIFY